MGASAAIWGARLRVPGGRICSGPRRVGGKHMEKLILAAVLVVAGLLPVGVVLLRRRRNQRMMREGVRTHAVVSEVLTGINDGMQLITIEYHPQTGPAIRRRMSLGGGPYAMGQKIEMIYDPADPQRMMLGWKTYDGLLLVLAGALALFLIAFAVRLVVS